MKQLIILAATMMAVATISSCKSSKKNADTDDSDAVATIGPEFNADSAYAYCAAQCDFGPRTMNSEAHDRCADWIEQKFRQFGCEVQLQKADLKGYDGTTLKTRNIIARANPSATTRLLVCAHTTTVAPGQTTTPIPPTGASP